MMQKLEKLLDVAVEALVEVRDYYAAQNGRTLSLTDVKVIEFPPAAPRRKKNKEPATASATAIPSAAVNVEASPFGGEEYPSAEFARATPEDTFEAKRRCEEVMGLFIRRFLKANPSGLERAKAILNKECGHIVAKLEDLTYVEHVKLIPIFEAELEKVA